ncbi:MULTISPECIES: hypothetical protein [Mycolicibacterium]|uniref:hypothetical protein n=1 Tax=Mycolicibacterium TaxID=1866885 RepID=UPI00262ACE30|nr:hypothetical protein [Mycolicibacterium fortuitum]
MIDVVLHQTVRYRGHLDRSAVTELLAEHCKAGIGQLADLDDEQLTALVSAAFAVGNCELQEAVFDMIEKNNEVTRESWDVYRPVGG